MFNIHVCVAMGDIRGAVITREVFSMILKAYELENEGPYLTAKLHYLFQCFYVKPSVLPFAGSF